MTAAELLHSAATIAGADAVRLPAAPEDAIDGVVPKLVVSPRTGPAVAATLAWASEQALSTVIRGAGTKTGWGRTPRTVDVLLGTENLSAVLTHASGDLTATVQAGARLADVNRTLARAGQWLPLDPPLLDQATIGGLIATNDSGPLRHRYGTPRDLILGVQLATTDGQLAKAGGQVVKNVAGYDLSKLVCGSFGSLAAIVSATFRLAPLPASSGTLVARMTDASALARVLRELMSGQLDATSIDVDVDLSTADATFALLIRFMSPASSVQDRLDRAAALFGDSASLSIAQADDEDRIWSAHRAVPWIDDGVIVRASWRPAAIDDVVRELAVIGRSAGPIRLVGRAAMGSGLVRFTGDPPAIARAIGELRRSSLMSHVVIQRAPSSIKGVADVFDIAADRARLLASVKKALDPEGILNAGRGPL